MLDWTLIGLEQRVVVGKTLRERPRHRGCAGGVEIQAALLKFGTHFVALGGRLVAAVHSPLEQGVRESDGGGPAVRTNVNALLAGPNRRNYHYPSNQNEDPEPERTAQVVQGKPPLKPLGRIPVFRPRDIAKPRTRGFPLLRAGEYPYLPGGVAVQQ